MPAIMALVSASRRSSSSSLANILVDLDAIVLVMGMAFRSGGAERSRAVTTFVTSAIAGHHRRVGPEILSDNKVQAARLVSLEKHFTALHRLIAYGQIVWQDVRHRRRG